MGAGDAQTLGVLDMSLRRKTNSHDIWQKWCRVNGDLLEGLPREVLEKEARFREFVTKGFIVNHTGQKVADVKELTDNQLGGLWKFINVVTDFDMDAILFDAFNTEWHSRGCPVYEKFEGK